KVFRDTIIIPSIDFYAQHGANRNAMLANPKKWADTFHTAYEKRAAKVRTRQGLRKLLKRLHAKEIPCILLSNHTHDGILRQLKRLRLETAFDAVLCNHAHDATLKKRTKLGRLKTYLKKTGIAAKKVWLLGDSPEETRMARAVGAVSISICGGYYSEKRLRAAKPDRLTGSLLEVAGLL
ncbi:MAG: HAD hydrolase-like protein, partial [Candidatus Micrarchaeota archaeon]|nr:HAD hydrolase-like protein [Candidatus Micrarchaeota archaeon]